METKGKGYGERTNRVGVVCCLCLCIRLGNYASVYSKKGTCMSMHRNIQKTTNGGWRKQYKDDITKQSGHNLLSLVVPLSLSVSFPIQPHILSFFFFLLCVVALPFSRSGFLPSFARATQLSSLLNKQPLFCALLLLC